MTRLLNDAIRRGILAASMLVIGFAGLGFNGQGFTGLGFMQLKAQAITPIDSSKPIEITADQLDVFNEQQLAIFKGNVVVIQDNAKLTTPELKVFYESDESAGSAGGASGSGSASSSANSSGNTNNNGSNGGDGSAQNPASNLNAENSIKKLEAKGPVRVEQDDQIGTGDFAIYEKRNNLIKLKGNVKLIQGKNVIKGDELIINLTTQESRVITKSKQRVRALFHPNDAQKKP